MKKILIFLLGVFLLSGCGFHPRRARDIPPSLHTLYLKTQNPYNPFITQLKALLTSLDIKLVKHHSQAPYTLNVINVVFSQSNPAITTTTLAVSFTYSLNVTIQINDRSGKAVTPLKTLHATRSISQNASQVYTPGTATLVKQELQHDIISQIYYVLVSNNLRKSIQHVLQSE